MTKPSAKMDNKPEEKKEEVKATNELPQKATNELPKASNALPKASNELPKGPPKKLDTSWLTAAQNKNKINPFGQKKPEET